MKALTLTQPWATLVAIGTKKIETRSWSTNYQGPLAIHAAKKMDRFARGVWVNEPFLSALKDHLVDVTDGIIGTSYQLIEERLHLGCVLATCTLVKCYRIPPVEKRETLWPLGGHPIVLPPYSSDWDYHFGDYSPGRYAWILADVKQLSATIPARGALGLWEWEGK